MTTARNENLDALRAAAILGVLASHTLILAPLKIGVALSWIGQFGVDLFFVLSGWLIGGLFWRELRERGQVDVGRFVLRRVLRTAPPYYVILPFAWSAAHFFSPAAPPFDWHFLVFLQNYLPKIPFFSISWSLCVEEHFYLVFPMSLMLLARLGAPLKLVLWTLLIFSPLCRTFLETTATVDEFDATVLGTHLRLDGLAVGILLSYIHTFDMNQWQVVRRWSRRLLPLAIVFPFISPNLPDRLFYEIGLTLMAVSLAVLVVNASQDSPWRLTQVPGIAMLAKISYSVYLTHSLVIHATRQLAGLAGSHANLCYWLLIPVTLLAVGYAFFWLVEKQTFQLRRWIMES